MRYQYYILAVSTSGSCSRHGLVCRDLECLHSPQNIALAHDFGSVEQEVANALDVSVRRTCSKDGMTNTLNTKYSIRQGPVRKPWWVSHQRVNTRRLK